MAIYSPETLKYYLNDDPNGKVSEIVQPIQKQTENVCVLYAGRLVEEGKN